MKIAYNDKENLVILKEVGNNYTVLKSMGMRWDKPTQTLQKVATLSFLNSLSRIIRLPEKLEAERQRLTAIDEAVATERSNEKSVPYIKPPIKPGLIPYQHQTKAYNMALIIFGLVEPQEVVKCS